MSDMKKHIGQLNTTGTRCIVVFRELPDDDQHCLIVETDRLPDMYHQNMMDFVNSAEAQKTNDFYEILNRRQFGDGTNALQALHYKNILRKTPVENVSLLPFPGRALPLELVNAQIKGDTSAYEAKQKLQEEAKLEETRAANPLTDMTDPKAIAQGLIIQAELLEEEARAKREEAYALVPELDSGKDERSRGRPPLTPEQKAISQQNNKIRRRERDRERAAERREAKKMAELQAKVDAKIMRDAARMENNT